MGFKVTQFKMDEQFNLKNIEIIIGLGNSGNEYLNTRHNAGFEFLDFISNGTRFVKDDKLKSFVADVNINGQRLRLLKPTTMMNYSGEAFVLALNYFKVAPEKILVAFDDLDLPLGEFKIQLARGPKVHNGLLSLENRSKIKEFWRLRLGVDSRDEVTKANVSGSDYVLAKFKIKERDLLQETFFKVVEQII